jgi:hypothetical protein
MKALLIKSCSNSVMWYHNHIGKVVPLLKVYEKTNEYLSREPEGYSNIVLMNDAEVVDVSSSSILYLKDHEKIQ